MGYTDADLANMAIQQRNDLLDDLALEAEAAQAYAKTLGACLRREWLARVGDRGLSYELTEAGLNAVTA